MRDVYLFLFCLPDLCSRLGASQPVELGGGAKARHCREASRTLTTSQGNAATAWCRGGPLSVPPARRPLWNSILDSGDTEPALTRDAGCYSISRIYGRVRISTI